MWCVGVARWWSSACTCPRVSSSSLGWPGTGPCGSCSQEGRRSTPGGRRPWPPWSTGPSIPSRSSRTRCRSRTRRPAMSSSTGERPPRSSSSREGRVRRCRPERAGIDDRRSDRGEPGRGPIAGPAPEPAGGGRHRGPRRRRGVHGSAIAVEGARVERAEREAGGRGARGHGPADRPDHGAAAPRLSGRAHRRGASRHRAAAEERPDGARPAATPGPGVSAHPAALGGLTGTLRPVDVARVVEGVLGGERRAVARAISMVEDGADGLPELIGGLYPKTGTAYTVGLTGSPGVGKSSLAAELVTAARGRDLTMAALAAPEAVRVLDASGADLVIVETVGAGQAEVEVATAADTTLVVVAPGWGDAVQASKAGILEIADVFVVNKADRPGAGEAVGDLEVMLKMGPELEWTPPVLRTSTQAHEGIDDLWEAIEAHRKHLESTGELERRRRSRILREVEGMASERLRDRAAELLERGALETLADDLVARRVDPYRAADILVERMEAR